MATLYYCREEGSEFWSVIRPENRREILLELEVKCMPSREGLWSFEGGVTKFHGDAIDPSVPSKRGVYWIGQHDIDWLKEEVNGVGAVVEWWSESQSGE